jgi:hypothetical protein
LQHGCEVRLFTEGQPAAKVGRHLSGVTDPLQARSAWSARVTVVSPMNEDGRCAFKTLVCAKLDLRMRAGWIRILALIGVAALLGNAQCYAKCVSAPCGSGHAPSDSCHHQKTSQGDPASCPSQYSDISCPEAGIARISLETTTIVTLPVLTQDSSAAVRDPQFLTQVDTGSPPGRHCCSTISVLRI